MESAPVVSSSFKAIPGGTDITYVNVPGGIAYPSIVVRNGSTTGRLSQFHLSVDVTFDGSFWFWDGTYWMGGGD